MAKLNRNTKNGYGLDITDPQDAIHMGEGKRIRLEDEPLPDSAGDHQVGNRIYNDERYLRRDEETLKDIPIAWVFDGNKTYNIDPIYYLNEVNLILLNRVPLYPFGLDYTEDPDAGTITLGELTNPDIGDMIYMNLKVIEI